MATDTNQRRNDTMPHTPGPWDSQRGDPYDTTFEVNSLGDPWAAIANVNANTTGSLPVDEETAEANALLIAAAPELLAACQLAEDMICGRLSGVDPENLAVLPAIRAAILKAKGQAELAKTSSTP